MSSLRRTTDGEKGKSSALEVDPVDWYELRREVQRIEELVQGAREPHSVRRFFSFLALRSWSSGRRSSQHKKAPR